MSCPYPAPPGIDLENIVYYKDDTHYFVMTAKKQCLLRLGVLRQVRQTWARACWAVGPGRGGRTWTSSAPPPPLVWREPVLPLPCPFLHPKRLPSAGIYMVI